MRKTVRTMVKRPRLLNGGENAILEVREATRRSLPARHTHRFPAATATGAHTHVEQPRPDNFVSWWAWGVSQAQELHVIAPIAIHSQGGDRSGWGNVKRGVPRGLPFTNAFTKHILRDRPFVGGAFTRGMSHLYSRTSRQTDEFRIANALVSGHTDPEVVRIVLLGSPHVAYFQETAIRALAFIHEKVMAELATAKDPDAPAGAA